MKQSVSFTVDGEIVPQGRPKVRVVKGVKPWAQVYDPAKSRDFKNYVKMMAVRAMEGQAPFSGPLAVKVTVFRSIPKSMTKRDRLGVEYGVILPDKKPDLENQLKSIFDGMSGVVYGDDRQIVRIEAAKVYSDRPRAEIEVRPA